MFLLGALSTYTETVVAGRWQPANSQHAVTPDKAVVVGWWAVGWLIALLVKCSVVIVVHAAVESQLGNGDY